MSQQPPELPEVPDSDPRKKGPSTALVVVLVVVGLMLLLFGVCVATLVASGG